ncbi:MAG TPA: glycosyl hydrolase family 39 [Candidatus Sulfotelmatobacter sp.]|nr:glycosyl hydrolase family 39 [Candidatus Sulfotelmatobacter sp.]
MKIRLEPRMPAVVAVLFCSLAYAAAQDRVSKVTVNWDKVVRVTQTTPTLQVVVNPPLQRGTPVHDNAFQALRDLGADYVRYVPWLPYPKLGVAELEPPKDGKTSWDFTPIDPMTIDFLEATKGHSTILNFSTIPQWMYKTDKPVPYPADPNQVTWEYEQGTELRDPSMKEVAGYYARLLSWYTNGGFTDELGKRHESGYHYSIPYWEVLNEIDFEHHISPETYTKLYDEVVLAMKKVQPRTEFVGLALAMETNPQYFEYFLDHKNHKPGVPLDFISYHFYAVPTVDETPEVEQFTYFAQADGFLKSVRYIEAIRKRLSPETKTTVDELGVISADDLAQGEPGHVVQPIPNSYWNLAGAMYAYVFGELAQIGIDVAGESQLVGFPTQFPSVSMVDWNNGKPNARFWVLKLLHDNFGPGDKQVEIEPAAPSAPNNPYLYSLAFATHAGKRKLLLVNKRDRAAEVSVAGGAGGRVDYVDQTTAFNPPATARLTGDVVKLGGFSVAVLTLP